MRVVPNKKLSNLLLIPMNTEEQKALDAVITKAKPGEVFLYRGAGRYSKNIDIDDYATVLLYIGGRKERQEVKGGSKEVFIGGMKFELRGSKKGDKEEINLIRDKCFFVKPSVIYVDNCNVNGKNAIIITMSRCKHCNSGIIEARSSQYQICRDCAKKCTHDFSREIPSSGYTKIGCVHCGTIKNKPIKKIPKKYGNR